MKVNRNGVARELDVSLHTIDEWLIAGVPGKKVDGRWKFDLDEVKAWKEARRGNGKSPRGSITLGEARKRKLVADTALSRFELRRRKREYVPAAQVAEVWCRLVSNVKGKMLTIPSKLAPLLVSISDPNVIRERASG